MPNLDKDSVSCEFCSLSFGSRSSLYRHSKKEHTKELADKKRQSHPFKCQSCSASYTCRKTLLLHQKKLNHGDNELISDKHKPEGNFVCPVESCALKFRRQRNRVLHLKHKHGILQPVQNSFHCMEPGCNEMSGFPEINNLIKHLDDTHQIKIASTTLNFESAQDFDEWKSNHEASTGSRFVYHSSWIKLDGTKCSKYKCHRSGVYKPRVENNNRQRRLKSQGSCKIGQQCTAKITTNTAENGKLTAEAVLNHYGHVMPEKPGVVKSRTKRRLRQTQRLAASLQELLTTRRIPEEHLLEVTRKLKACVALVTANPELPSNAATPEPGHAIANGEQQTFLFSAQPCTDSVNVRASHVLQPPQSYAEPLPVRLNAPVLPSVVAEPAYVLERPEQVCPRELMISYPQ